MLVGHPGLLLLLTTAIFALQPFYSRTLTNVLDQTTLAIPSGSSSLSSSNPSISTYPVPTAVGGRTVSLSLLGFWLTSSQKVNFDATWDLSGTSVTIKFIIVDTVLFPLVKYNVLVVDSSLQMLWLQNESICLNM